MIDNLICKTCRGKRVVQDEHGKVVICPKCKGTGTINFILPEAEISNKKMLLD